MASALLLHGHDGARVGSLVRRCAFSEAFWESAVSSRRGDSLDLLLPAGEFVVYSPAVYAPESSIFASARIGVVGIDFLNKYHFAEDISI